MEIKALTELLISTAKEQGVDADLVLAITSQESGFDSLAVRYEEHFTQLVTPRIFSINLGITEGTESILQKMSWGCMQIMGAVTRELGYHGHLTGLTDPALAVLYGCKKLASLKLKYEDESNVIAAYNAGSPGKVNGRYRNQKYVDSVKKNLLHLRSIN